MKGISAVLATVMIVVITVAIIGLAYGWATGLFDTLTDTGDDQVGGLNDRISDDQKSIQLEDVTCDTSNAISFKIKSTGMKDIAANELTVSVNGILVNTEEEDGDITFPLAPALTPIEAGDTSVLYTITTGTSGTYTLIVDAPAEPVEVEIGC